MSGRTRTWLKTPCRKRDTFVIAGVALKGRKFDGIYLGRPTGKELAYAGKVERGFSDDDKERLLEWAKRLKAPKPALTPKIKKTKAIWLKPSLQADVEYRALTGDGKVRHPSFKGIRGDLEAVDQ